MPKKKPLYNTHGYTGARRMRTRDVRLLGIIRHVIQRMRIYSLVSRMRINVTNKFG